MKLIGRYMSPFVRRVGVSLHLLDVPFTNEPLSVLTDSLKIRGYSPLGRLPALVLDDGQVLIDSNAILDYFDQQAGAERALLPLSGPQRSEAMNLLAFAVGACEKTVAAYYERDRRPEGLVWDDWYRHCEDQARGALALLDAHQAERGERPLLGERMSQVDISAVVAYDFARITLPDTLAPNGTFPHLASASQRANALPAFAQTQWKG
ncbi:glutathione S-transferase family protein [Stutzerimonas kunmingensis]|uniref:glutathione S-transferase family protein n=1 Tax=Stutzerimonas kunmingensis TaxID=1211807 RepID=UPI0028ACACF0|nr:glutathione S-transferase family protein [Stutzerimonas kunmingensis]